MPNVPIYFLHYDSKTRKAVARTVTTDPDGLAKIAIPSEPDASSSIFAFSLRDNMLPMLRTPNNLAIRIPPAKVKASGAGQKQIVLRFDGETMKWKGSIQLMSFPTDGTGVVSDDSAINIVEFDESTGKANLNIAGSQLGIIDGQQKPIGVGDVLLEGSTWSLHKP